jgi:hypothetical protein
MENQMQHIVRYTPQQNGVTKRNNYTLNEMENCMIQYKGLSLQFLVEIIDYTNYIVNFTLTKALKIIKPEEAWSKIKLYVSYFHLFGSEAYAKIPNEKSKELHPKSEKWFFVGYYEDVKYYRLHQPNSNEIIIRKDAKFNEGVLAYETNLVFSPYSTCEPSLMYFSCYLPKFYANDLIMVYSSDDDNEDENPSPTIHISLVGYIEHELAPTS